MAQEAAGGDYKQLSREVLSEIPLVGGQLRHKLLPTKAEENAGKIHRPSRRMSTKDNFSY
jgi:hypothetical protein